MRGLSMILSLNFHFEKYGRGMFFYWTDKILLTMSFKAEDIFTIRRSGGITSNFEKH